MTGSEPTLKDLLENTSVLDGDHINEFQYIVVQVENALETHGHTQRDDENGIEFMRRMDPEIVMRAIKSVRASGGKVRTIKQRLLDENSLQAPKPGTPTYRALVKELEENPTKARRLDEIAGILNTTEDYQTFRAAFNEAMKLFNREMTWD